MNELNLVYDYVVYSGAGHAFMRIGDGPEGEGMNKKKQEIRPSRE